MRSLTQFSHLAADTIINGSATAHMAPTDHADRKEYWHNFIDNHQIFEALSKRYYTDCSATFEVSIVLFLVSLLISNWIVKCLKWHFDIVSVKTIIVGKSS